jgi:oligopeptide transport system substrate-binding protein
MRIFYLRSYTKLVFSMKSALNVFFLVALCVCLFACGERKTLVDLGTEQQILHLGNGTEPAEVDPHTTTGIPEYHLQMALFEGLVSKHPETLEIVPAVAEQWNISEDGLVYTFHIRTNAKWSNGEALVANDFVLSWQRALSAALGNQYASMLYSIKNAEAYHLGKITDFAEVGVKTLGDHTLQITLENPTPYFLQILDHHSAYPVHVPTLLKYGRMDEAATRWTRAENFVGNGPFVIKEWTPGKVFSVVRNSHYWDEANVKLNEIRFYPIDQSLVEERMFKAGQLHKTETMPSTKIERYRKQNSTQYKGYLYFGTYFYLFNVTKKPLDDVRVRKALAYSVDRESITRNITKGGQMPTYALTPPETLGYTSRAKMTYDIELARKLLAEAGYPDGKGFPKLELVYNTSQDHQKIAVAIQQMWKKALNIDITLQNQEWKVFLNNQQLLNYQISRRGWIGDYIDPYTFLELFVTNGGNNNTGWSNARYDELLRLSTSAKSREERYEYFQEAEQILVDEAPILPIYNYTTNYLLSEDLKGYYPNTMDYHPYKYMYLESGKKGEE